MTNQIPHVVIIGGGFGGLAAARALKSAPVRITLLDRANHHLFQPLLYQVAIAGLSAADIAAPIRSILRKQKNVTVLLDEAVNIDLDQQIVELKDGRLSYDFLIIATGGRTSYFGNDAWEKFAPGMKSLEDALEIRRRVLLSFELAEKEDDPVRRQELMTFVVVGGGPTGVELAGAISELARYALTRDFRNINPSDARVILLEGGPRVLPSFAEDLSASAEQQLTQLGVQVRVNALVKNIEEARVYLDGETIQAATIIWGAGIQASTLANKIKAPRDRIGRLILEPDLTLPGNKNVFAIGDTTSFTHQTGNPLPGVSPVAMQMGRTAAENILRAIKGESYKLFKYIDKGSMATIGRHAAIAEIGKIHLSGFIAWAAWLFIHLIFLIGFRNRIAALFNWAWSYFTYQRGARLITGSQKSVESLKSIESGESKARSV